MVVLSNPAKTHNCELALIDLHRIESSNLTDLTNLVPYKNYI